MINNQVGITVSLLCAPWQMTGRSVVLFSRRQGPESGTENGARALSVRLYCSPCAGETNACQKALSSSVSCNDGTSRSDALALNHDGQSSPGYSGVNHGAQSGSMPPVADGNCVHASCATGDGGGDRFSPGDRSLSLSEGARLRSQGSLTPGDAVAMERGLSLETPQLWRSSRLSGLRSIGASRPAAAAAPTGEGGCCVVTGSCLPTSVR